MENKQPQRLASLVNDHSMAETIYDGKETKFAVFDSTTVTYVVFLETPLGHIYPCMDTLIAQLDQKYRQYQQNLYESESSEWSHFSFDCAYEYLCITEGQPHVKVIIEQDWQEVAGKKLAIIRENKSEDIQKEITEKIETNSLSFCYGEIFRDVYTPMRKYNESLNPLSPPEIIGDTVIVTRTLSKIASSMAEFLIRTFSLSTRKDIDARIALLKIKDNFNQKKYPVYMETIHTTLVPKLLEAHTRKQTSSKIRIIVSDKKGIYRADNEKISYGIDRLSKRLRIIKHLVVQDNCGISELMEISHQDKGVVVKSIREINKKFRGNLGETNDIIVHDTTGGYSLNKETFDVELSA